MATRWAVANGNWSNTATWNGGTLPTSADDVFSNNFTVTIDQDITAISLRNTSNTSPAITQGGSFVVSGSSGTRNITLTGVSSSVVGVLTGFVAAVSPLLNITATGTAITNINSNLIGGGAGGATATVGLVINGNSTVNVVGRVGPSSQFTSAIVSQSSGAIITIVGNVFGSPSGNGVNITQPATLTVTGAVTGNTTTATGNGIAVGATSTVTVTGNLFGGAGTSAQAILTSVAGSTINIIGNLTGSSGEALGDGGVIGAFNITGNPTASSTRAAVHCTTTTLVTVAGNPTNASNVNAIYAQRIRISPSVSMNWTYQTSGSDRALYTSDSVLGVPAVTDVRSGVVYANGTLTGTCNVPAAASVSFGVPVDNTTGTAINSRAQFIADMGALLAAYNV